MITITHYLVLSAILFTLGVIGVLIRRNAIVIFMCIELMLNAVNLSFVAFAHYLNSMHGQLFVFFTLDQNLSFIRTLYNGWHYLVKWLAHLPSTYTFPFAEPSSLATMQASSSCPYSADISCLPDNP